MKPSSSANPSVRRSPLSSGPLSILGALALCFSVACGNKEDELPFQCCGDDFDNNSGSDGGGGGGSGAAPEITAVNITYESDYGGSPALLVNIAYTDADEDVEDGGVVSITVTENDGDPQALGDLSIGDAQAQVDEDGSILVGISDVDQDNDYVVDVVLTDAAGNASASASAQYPTAE